MNNFIGIDLGTTNSAICSYDGEHLRLWKSPVQNDVTPSVIYFDRRSSYIGSRAYDLEPHSPGNAAKLFKRYMGTSTPMGIPEVGRTMTPEECSAEILKVLFGYLPEDIRNSEEIGTVITVPAAFNQMQKDATIKAAEMAGIGRVALMQEPVAAVMSVMQEYHTDGSFLIYDLGGGTLDIAIADSLSGRVSLLAHGGIEMCGGRDFDRAIVNNLIKPWLMENFNLPENFVSDDKFKKLVRLANWATEKAKIELSSKEESMIQMSESEVRMNDLEDNEIYLDIPLNRSMLDPLIEPMIMETIEAARNTIRQSGMDASDLERIVFVGGPTHYKPLRDKVAFELGLRGSTEVNPMTAVALGAALFAESIDWSSQTHGRKSSRGQVNTSGKNMNIQFKYSARTSDVKTRILVGECADISGFEFQIDNLDTGWSSGRMPLTQRATLEVSLPKKGINTFKIFVFDTNGGPVALDEDRITIMRSAVTVDAIPVSHSMCIEVLDRAGGTSEPCNIIKAGDHLPKTGQEIFKTIESLKAGSPNAINFKIWEGEIAYPIQDNQYIGLFEITGADLEEGVIPAGTELHVEYQILDSGNLILEVSIPFIGASFRSRNLYSSEAAKVNYAANAKRTIEDGHQMMDRLDAISTQVDDDKLDQAKDKLSKAASLHSEEDDPEVCKKAADDVLEAKKLLAQTRQEHLKEIRQMDLDSMTAFFEESIRQFAKPVEVSQYEKLLKTAQRAIDRNNSSFERHLDELRSKNSEILWRQDWFVIDRFKNMADESYLFLDQDKYQELVQAGQQAIAQDNIQELRDILASLYSSRVGSVSEDEMLAVANIVRG